MSQRATRLFHTFFGRAMGPGAPALDPLEARLALAADVAVSVSAVSAPGEWVAPGERLGATVVLENLGNTAFRGKVTVRLEAVRTDQGDSAPIGKLVTRAYVLPGARVSLKVDGLANDQLDPGMYQLRATVTGPDGGVPLGDINPANNSGTSAAAREVAYRFGTFGGRRDAVMTVNTGPQGDLPTTFRITGVGYGQLELDAPLDPGERLVDLATVALRGTDDKSALSITTYAGRGVTLLNDIHAFGDLGSIGAASVSLNGTDIITDGTLGGATLGDLHAVDIDIFGTARALSFRAENLHDTKLESFAPITRIDVLRWTDSAFATGGSSRSRLTAPNLSSISCTFDFEPKVRVPATAAAPIGGGIYEAIIGGTVKGDWSVHGVLKTLKAGAADARFSANVTGNIDNFTTNLDFRGTLVAGTIGEVLIGRDADGGTILSGPDLGDDAAPGGTAENADQFVSDPALGRIGMISVYGAVRSSFFGLAYNPAGLDGPEFIAGQSGECGSIFVAGTVSGDSRFAGLAFPSLVTINSQSVATAGNPLFVTQL